MISLPGVPPVPGVHDAAPLKEATTKQEKQRTAHHQQQILAETPQTNQPVHKVIRCNIILHHKPFFHSYSHIKQKHAVHHHNFLGIRHA